MRSRGVASFLMDGITFTFIGCIVYVAMLYILAGIHNSADKSSFIGDSLSRAGGQALDNHSVGLSLLGILVTVFLVHAVLFLNVPSGIRGRSLRGGHEIEASLQNSASDVFIRKLHRLVLMCNRCYFCMFVASLVTLVLQVYSYWMDACAVIDIFVPAAVFASVAAYKYVPQVDEVGEYARLLSRDAEEKIQSDKRALLIARKRLGCKITDHSLDSSRDLTAAVISRKCRYCFELVSSLVRGIVIGISAAFAALFVALSSSYPWQRAPSYEEFIASAILSVTLVGVASIAVRFCYFRKLYVNYWPFWDSLGFNFIFLIFFVVLTLALLKYFSIAVNLCALAIAIVAILIFNCWLLAWVSSSNESLYAHLSADADTLGHSSVKWFEVLLAGMVLLVLCSLSLGSKTRSMLKVVGDRREGGGMVVDSVSSEVSLWEKVRICLVIPEIVDQIEYRQVQQERLEAVI